MRRRRIPEILDLDSVLVTEENDVFKFIYTISNYNL